MNPPSTLRPGRLLALLAAWLPLLALAPGVAYSERGPLRTPTNASADDPSGARVIVKFKAGGSLMRAAAASSARGPQHAATLAQRHGLALTDGRIIDRRSQVVRGGPGTSSAALAAELAADTEVEYAVPDGRRYALAAPNDPLYGPYAGTPAPVPSTDVAVAVGQWYLRAPDATAVAATGAVNAWDVSTGAPAIIIADLDTGVLFNHPDLAGKLYPGYDFVSDSTYSRDGNGVDNDATDPGDWTTANQCPGGNTASSSSWHGTQTAGILGAQTNNGIGMAGMGYNTMVAPVRVLSSCGGTDSDIIAAMLWAGGVSSTPVANPHPARVINMSLGGSGSCSAAYVDAINQLTAANVVVVVAAGNAEGLAVGTPANCAGVIAVAAVRHLGTKVGFSSIGPEVAIAAPGGNCINTTGACLYPILTTINTGATTAATNTYSDSSNYSAGTSFSTPIVAGTVALMLAANPALTPAQVKNLLQTTSRAFPTVGGASTVQACHAPTSTVQDECYCVTGVCGAGLLDAAAAVAGAAGVGAVPASVITSTTTTPAVGSTITLEGIASSRTAVAYQWAISAGATLASFSGSTTSPTVGLNVTGAGTIKVTLMVTQPSGATATSEASFAATAGPVAVISPSTTDPVVGTNIVFDGSGSTPGTGRTITAYHWAITSGSTVAAISGSATAATATVTPSAAGSFTIALTITDSSGAQASQSSAVTVNAAPPASSGGGGAVSPAWLLGLALAVALLALTRTKAGHGRP